MSQVLEEARLLTGPERMTLLCESFPVLRHADGVRPWDQHKFAAWATGSRASGWSPSAATRLAAAFVLGVWNGLANPKEGDWWNERPYRVGRFDVVEAFQRWDEDQQAAFIAWCEAPFFP